ncbi:MAG: radical SAM protein [Alphaproteobacteria bacterium]|nr:MAG: radical SAM protein [Alphaproteobacteria bacterium]
MTAIAISRLHYPVTTLGPGRRIGIWMQGCSIRCPGCISMDTWAHGRGMTTVEDVLCAISRWLHHDVGVTISGGEPFDQPLALAALLRSIRTASAADILVFTGYAREAVADELRRLEGLADALMSDPFERFAPQTLALRGSDNQRLHLLTPLGVERFSPYDRAVNAREQNLDLMFDDDGAVWLAGIPRPHDLRRLQSLLRAQGHDLAVSEDAWPDRSQSEVAEG